MTHTHTHYPQHLATLHAKTSHSQPASQIRAAIHPVPPLTYGEHTL